MAAIVKQSLYVLPEISGRWPHGQERINQLVRVANELTALADQMKKKGIFTRLNWPKIWRAAQNIRPEDCRYMQADPETGQTEIKGVSKNLFTFTGRRVIIVWTEFFKEYEATPEGQRYRKETEAGAAAALYGAVAAVDLSELEGEGT